MTDPRLGGLVQWSRGEIAPPHTLDISPTDWCNLQCRTCWMRGERYGERFTSDYQLSDERLLSLIDEAAALGVRHIELTGGGEPLMRRPLMLEMMHRIKAAGMEGSMTTNGTLFDEQSVREVAKMGWDRIVFSIDGPDAKGNDWLRPLRGSTESPFSRIVTALEMFKRVKQENTPPSLAFNIVLSLKNKDMLEKMMRFAAEHGVEWVNFEPMTIHSEQGKQLRLSGQDVREMQPEVRRAQAAAGRLGICTNISRFAESSLVTKKNEMPAVYAKDVKSSDVGDGSDGFLSIPCYEPWYHMVVKTDGSVGPCCVFEDKAVNVKSMSLADIWTGGFMAGVRARLEFRDFLQWCRICNAGQVLQNRGLREMLGKALSGSRGDANG